MADGEVKAGGAWSPRRIAVGSDHAGFELKSKIIAHLEAREIEALDQGADDGEQSVDYPEFGARVARAVAAGKADAGILVCGTGIGQSITANKVHGVRAALVTDKTMATMAREHNDANVLVLGGRILDDEEALQFVDIYLDTPFEGGRHQRRLDKISGLERPVPGDGASNILGGPSWIADFDPELFEAIRQEEVRQETHLELIASENFVSRRVMEAASTVLTNKYAEGYPGKRCLCRQGRTVGDRPGL